MIGSEPHKELDTQSVAPSPHGTEFHSSVAKPTAIEDQLAHVIQSARDVAVAAEELLREFTTSNYTTATEAPHQPPHAIVLAPRLLSATQQQLESLLAMMRTI